MLSSAESVLRSAPQEQVQPAETPEFGLREVARFIRERMQGRSGDVVEIGRRLERVHRMLGRSRFQAWLQKEFAWDRSLASRYMSVARVFETAEAYDVIQPSALYLLARKSVSPVARQEALRMAREGLPVSRKTALGLIRQHSSPKRSRSAEAPAWKGILQRAKKLPLADVLQLTIQLAHFARANAPK